ncbi:hypothetical protein [Sorangium sp. So ce1151]|uniref:hypothetical protein n=1 Tax=Sorangium sp. So ce1151 TaxID=3133332 RepID=UPI003F609147
MTRARPPRVEGKRLRPKRWSRQTLVALRAVHRWMAGETRAARSLALYYRRSADDGELGGLMRVDELVRQYEQQRAREEALAAFIGDQGTRLAPGDPDYALANELMVELFDTTQRKSDELAGVFGRELAATSSPGATAGERDPATRGQEGESRQACEPAGPARGSRRAEGHLSTQSGPGGASTPAEPNATSHPKGRADDK